MNTEYSVIGAEVRDNLLQESAKGEKEREKSKSRREEESRKRTAEAVRARSAAKTHTEIGITDAITTPCLSMYDTIHLSISCIHVLDRSLALVAL